MTSLSKLADWLEIRLSAMASAINRLPEWVSAAATIFGMAWLVFARALLRPGLMVSGSDFLQFYFWEDFTRQELAAGRLALWNPYFFSGYPALANPQMMVLYPPASLLRLLPLSYSFGLGIMLHMGRPGNVLAGSPAELEPHCRDSVGGCFHDEWSICNSHSRRAS